MVLVAYKTFLDYSKILDSSIYNNIDNYNNVEDLKNYINNLLSIVCDPVTNKPFNMENMTIEVLKSSKDKIGNIQEIIAVAPFSQRKKLKKFEHIFQIIGINKDVFKVYSDPDYATIEIICTYKKSTFSFFYCRLENNIMKQNINMTINNIYTIGSSFS